MTIWTHRQLLKRETSLSPEYDVGKFKGPVFLKIQLPPGDVDHYVAVALELNDYAGCDNAARMANVLERAIGTR